jgi:hypothetical protein
MQPKLSRVCVSILCRLALVMRAHPDGRGAEHRRFVRIHSALLNQTVTVKPPSSSFNKLLCTVLLVLIAAIAIAFYLQANAL